MRRIYKWPLGPTTTVPWSPDDRVLLVADQRGEPTLWAEQEDAEAVSRRDFVVVGTGFAAPVDLEHVGSAVCGEFVWHVYAEPPVERSIAALTETLTRPRFHTFCGETHVPGPCNDGVTRPNLPPDRRMGWEVALDALVADAPACGLDPEKLREKVVGIVEEYVLAQTRYEVIRHMHDSLLAEANR